MSEFEYVQGGTLGDRDGDLASVNGAQTNPVVFPEVGHLAEGFLRSPLGKQTTSVVTVTCPDGVLVSFGDLETDVLVQDTGIDELVVDMDTLEGPSHYQTFTIGAETLLGFEIEVAAVSGVLNAYPLIQEYIEDGWVTMALSEMTEIAAPGVFELRFASPVSILNDVEYRIAVGIEGPWEGKTITLLFAEGTNPYGAGALTADDELLVQQPAADSDLLFALIGLREEFAATLETDDIVGDTNAQVLNILYSETISAATSSINIAATGFEDIPSA